MSVRRLCVKCGCVVPAGDSCAACGASSFALRPLPAVLAGKPEPRQ